jgi:hypothetical protein
MKTQRQSERICQSFPSESVLWISFPQDGTSRVGRKRAVQRLGGLIRSQKVRFWHSTKLDRRELFEGVMCELLFHPFVDLSVFPFEALDDLLLTHPLWLRVRINFWMVFWNFDRHIECVRLYQCHWIFWWQKTLNYSLYGPAIRSFDNTFASERDFRIWFQCTLLHSVFQVFSKQAYGQL